MGFKATMLVLIEVECHIKFQRKIICFRFRLIDPEVQIPFMQPRKEFSDSNQLRTPSKDTG